MPSHSTSTAVLVVLATLTLGACKTVYSDAYAYKKNNFQAPPEKKVAIEAPPAPLMPLEGAAPGGVIPGAPEAIPGVPGAPAPDGGIPGGIPGAPAPAAPGAAPAPGAPAIPGLN
jgi:hypothetical protein